MRNKISGLGRLSFPFFAEVKESCTIVKLIRLAIINAIKPIINI